MTSAMWEDLAGLPALRDWSALRRAFAQEVRPRFSAWISPDQPHFKEQLVHALGRFDEGASLLWYFERHEKRLPDRNLRLIDVGSGNGGTALAFSNCRRYQVHALDVAPNSQLTSMCATLGLPVRQTVGDGHALPFDRDSFDIALLIDTIEHVRDAATLGREIMRVLRPGGLCMITTPPRLRYFFARDPHYGIPCLVLLPNSMQRFVANRLLRRKVGGADGLEYPAYDVEHIFWTVPGVASAFPARQKVAVLFNKPAKPGRRLGPRLWRHTFGQFLWDKILISKAARG